MKKFILFTIIVLLLFLPIGCVSGGPEISKLEDLALVGVIGYDKYKEDKLKITMGIPQYEHGKETTTELYKDIDDLTHEGLIGVSTKSDRTLSYAQLRVVIFGEDFAMDNGLKNVIKELYRDPTVGDNVYIAVVEGRAEDFLSVENKNKQPISTYLNEILRPKRQTFFNPFSTIHDFIYSLTDEVTDPMLPYIEKGNKDMEVSKIALFKEDKMIDLIAPWEATLLYGLAGKKELAAIKIQLDEKNSKGKPIYVMLEFVQSKVKWKTNGNLDNPYMKLNVKLEGTLYGYTGKRNLENTEELISLQNEINGDIKRNIKSVLKKMQKLQIDPTRSGMVMRASYDGNWTKDKWRNSLPHVKYDVNVDTRIIGTGTLN